MSGKERKIRTVFNNYYDQSAFEDTKEFIFENAEDGEYESKESIPDSEVWDYYRLNIQDTWEAESEALDSFMQAREGFVIRGTVGRWDGRYDSGSVVFNLAELSKAWTDCDFIHIYDVDGHLKIDCSHHDGTNYWEVRKLTEKGLAYYQDHQYDYDPRTLHERLWKSPYSVLPHYAHIQRGCPKRETA